MERQRTSFFQSLRRSSKTSQPNPSPAATPTPTSPPSPSAQQPPQASIAQDPTISHNHSSQPSQDSAPAAAKETDAPTSSHGVQSASDRSSDPTSSATQQQQNGDVSAAKADASPDPQQQTQLQNVHEKVVDVANGHKAGQAWDADDPLLKVSAEEEAFLRSLGWTEPGDDEDGKLTAFIETEGAVLCCIAQCCAEHSCEFSCSLAVTSDGCGSQLQRAQYRHWDSYVLVYIAIIHLSVAHCQLHLQAVRLQDCWHVVYTSRAVVQSGTKLTCDYWTRSGVLLLLTQALNLIAYLQRVSLKKRLQHIRQIHSTCPSSPSVQKPKASRA